MKVSLIVTTYNWSKALNLTILSILNQTRLPDQVIIADDGSGEKTAELVESFRKKAKTPIIHSWQEDKGFRLAMSRNRAISQILGDYIIVIDGDLILHPLFIEDHLYHAKKRVYIQGKRVLLGNKLSSELLNSNEEISSLSFFSKDIKNRKNAINLRLLSKLFSKKKFDLSGIKGCNFSLYKEDLLAVNGFDNRFVGWGREDSEFAARLLNSGMVRKDLRFAAIAYHLYHKESTREALKENDRRLERTIKERVVRCEDGIDRFMKDNK